MWPLWLERWGNWVLDCAQATVLDTSVALVFRLVLVGVLSWQEWLFQLCTFPKRLIDCFLSLTLLSASNFSFFHILHVAHNRPLPPNYTGANMSAMFKPVIPRQPDDSLIWKGWNTDSEARYSMLSSYSLCWFVGLKRGSMEMHAVRMFLHTKTYSHIPPHLCFERGRFQNRNITITHVLFVYNKYILMRYLNHILKGQRPCCTTRKQQNQRRTAPVLVERLPA